MSQLSPEDQQRVARLEDLRDMFQTDGWEHLFEWAEAEKTKLNDLNLYSTQDQLMHAKGRQEVFDLLMQFPTLARETLQELKNPAVEDEPYY